MSRNGGFYFYMDWKVNDPNAVLHEGDYFDVVLPDNMCFPPDYTTPDFDITDADGNVTARARVNSTGPDYAGATMRVTFNDKVNNKYNVRGSIYLYALFNQSKIQSDQSNTFSVSVNGQVTSTNLMVGKDVVNPDEVLAKWGEKTSKADEAVWFVRVNYKKVALQNTTISDSLTGGAGNETYVPGSLSLKRVSFSDEGFTEAVYETVDISNAVTLSPDKRSFSIKVDNLGSNHYMLSYRTTYTSGTTLKNNVKLTDVDGSSETSASFMEQGSGGSAGGDLVGKIKLTKVDADDNVTPLKNAVFTVTRGDGSTFELTTGADGTITSSVLPQGTYKVKEKTPPAGYELNDEEYTLEVTSTGGALKTIADKPIKIAVNVNKKWVGPAGSSVTVRLLADGNDTGKTVVLDAASGWTGTFTDLRKCKPDGTEIKYTVTEAQVSGVDAGKYTTVVAGDAAAGFTITNTNTEKVDIFGAKIWDDDNNRDGDRPTSITVNLMRDGVKADSAVVMADVAGNWDYGFTGLAKYDPADGHEYKYTVTEEAVANYATEINGTAIKNSHTPGKTSLTVTKAWNDANNQDGIRPVSIKVQLYANDAALGALVELNEGNGWTHTWTGLFQKENGKDIAYSVKEVDVPRGYEVSITGDAATGFTLMNTHIPEIVSIPVVKKWVGGEGNVVTIHLLANGVDTGKKLVLGKDEGWKGMFSDLPKFAEGKEIVYTVTEDAVEGYTSAVSGDAASGFTVTNTAVPPETPKVVSVMPRTGDSAGGVAAAVTAIAGLAALGGAAAYRRREE